MRRRRIHITHWEMEAAAQMLHHYHDIQYLSRFRNHTWIRLALHTRHRSRRTIDAGLNFHPRQMAEKNPFHQVPGTESSSKLNYEMTPRPQLPSQ
jgi:hypothetical protein